jgi:hypothetical protein
MLFSEKNIKAAAEGGKECIYSCGGFSIINH